MGMPSRAAERRFLKLVADASHCTIATASPEGVPEAAIMAFASGPGLDLYLYTLNDSRKYRNLSRNPRVALILYQAPEYAQLDGSMEELAGEAAAAARRVMMEGSSGDREDYHQDPRCRYFLFSPERVCLRVDESYPSRYETWNPARETATRTREL